MRRLRSSDRFWLGIKRSLDVVVAMLGMLCLSPIFLAIAILIRIRLGQPVLFRQTRPGIRGAPFTLYKFRTMRVNSDPQSMLLADESRMTVLGTFLRRFSLDELPQLFNVLRGDISLVGPRPLLMDYLALYTPEQARRHEMRPGITGWAQVNGRNSISWEQKFALDIWYIDHWSIWLDLRILSRSFLKVLRGNDVSGHGVPTMQAFTGSPRPVEPVNRQDTKS